MGSCGEQFPRAAPPMRTFRTRVPARIVTTRFELRAILVENTLGRLVRGTFPEERHLHDSLCTDRRRRANS
jgi:hypothetical protein